MLDNLDGRAVLEHFGAQNCREIRRHDGTTEIVHSCLLDRVEPHHRNGDRNPSASLNLEKRSYCCFSWGRGCDLSTLVAKLAGEDVDLALLSVDGFLTDEDFSCEIDRLLREESASTTTELPTYSDAIIQPWANTYHAYWGQRGIAPDAVSLLRLGYDPHEARVVFPHWHNDRLVGWQKRAVRSGVVPKYRSSPGFPKSATLYHLDSARKHSRVCVVESPMSVARAVSLGLDNVVATFGAKVSQQQADLLSAFDVVYLWFDRDAAGAGGCRKMALMLERRTDVRVVAPAIGKDMADSDMQEIERRLAMSVPSWMSKVVNYG